MWNCNFFLKKNYGIFIGYEIYSIVSCSTRDTSPRDLCNNDFVCMYFPVCFLLSTVSSCCGQKGNPKMHLFYDWAWYSTTTQLVIDVLGIRNAVAYQLMYCSSAAMLMMHTTMHFQDWIKKMYSVSILFHVKWCSGLCMM